MTGGKSEEAEMNGETRGTAIGTKAATVGESDDDTGALNETLGTDWTEIGLKLTGAGSGCSERGAASTAAWGKAVERRRRHVGERAERREQEFRVWE
jgi:hypothetical protein